MRYCGMPMVPHDNNRRFLPWMIYEHLPQLRRLPRQYVRGTVANQIRVEREVGLGTEETGNLERENVQGGGDVTGDGTAAKTRRSPSEAIDKPEVESGQGASSGLGRQGVLLQLTRFLNRRIRDSFRCNGLIDHVLLLRFTRASIPRV